MTGRNTYNSAALPNVRAQQLLKSLVELYIREGQPVGSKTLVQQSGLAVSSATIRNIMSDLEEKGFIRSPHTSSGRIPTESGYRFFVDALLSVEPLKQQELKMVQDQLIKDSSDQALIRSASNLLSNLSHLAGVVSMPKKEYSRLRLIEFLPLSHNRVLTILVLNNDEVHNVVIQTGRAYTESELIEAGNYITHAYRGKGLTEIADELVRELDQDKERLSVTMQSVVDLVTRAFLNEEVKDAECLVVGESHLLDIVDERLNKDRIKQLFDAFNQKRDILHLLERCVHSEGVKIFIGHESGYELFDDCTLITAPYTEGGQVAGVLGVIGPTRIPYSRIIPLVDVTAKILSEALDRERE